MNTFSRRVSKLRSLSPRLARCWRLPLGLLLLAALAACSGTRLAYHHADWLIGRQIAGQFDLTREQRQWLRNELETHLVWHCQTQLPRYADWVARHRPLLTRSVVTPAELAAALTETQPFVTAAGERLTATAAPLLRDLSPDQIDHFRRRLDRHNRELAEEYLEPSAAEVMAQRSRKLERRLRPWVGRLTAAQRERITRWSAGQGDFGAAWLASRERWQTALLEALADPAAAQFDATIHRLLTTPASVHEPAWVERTAMAWEAGLVLAAALINSATSRQQQRLDARLDRLEADLAALRCD